MFESILLDASKDSHVSLKDYFDIASSCSFNDLLGNNDGSRYSILYLLNMFKRLYGILFKRSLNREKVG